VVKIDLNEEQKQIVEKIESKCRLIKGTQEKGKETCNIVKEYLQKHFSDKDIQIRPIEGILSKCEFLIITKKSDEGKDAPFDAVIKVNKKGGNYGNKEEYKESFKKLKILFDSIKEKNPEIICCYLAISNHISKNKDSDYNEMAKRELKHYGCFMLCDTKGNLISDSWQNFLKPLKLH